MHSKVYERTRALIYNCQFPVALCTHTELSVLTHRSIAAWQSVHFIGNFLEAPRAKGNFKSVKKFKEF